MEKPQPPAISNMTSPLKTLVKSVGNFGVNIHNLQVKFPCEEVEIQRSADYFDFEPMGPHKTGN
jgi:hypothetical protein